MNFYPFIFLLWKEFANVRKISISLSASLTKDFIIISKMLIFIIFAVLSVDNLRNNASQRFPFAGMLRV